MKETYSQEPDCCSPESYHSLVVEVDDGGGGPYVIISTHRWALSEEDIRGFTRMLRGSIRRVEKSQAKVGEDDCPLASGNL